MTVLDRINAILGSPRHRYVIGEIDYDEYRAMTEPSDTWPKHPDGTNMTIGEMPEEDRKRIMREAAARYEEAAFSIGHLRRARAKLEGSGA